LDDTFVKTAAVVELSAEQREARQRRERLEQELLEGREIAVRGKRRAVRRRWLRRAPLVLVLLLLAGSIAWLQADRSTSGPTVNQAAGGGGHSDKLIFNGTLIGRPPPTKEQATAPLGVPLPPSSRSAAFRFNEVQAGTAKPVAYDPCRPIHLVVNGRTAPVGAEALVAEALEAVSAATGLQLRVDGPSTEVPSEARLPHQVDRYPGRWAPVLLAWSDPEETPRLAGDTAGLGGSFALPVADQQVYVTGGVTLDGPQLMKVLKQPNGQAAARAVVEHELAHLVGLDHVADATQLMNPVGAPDVVTFGAGDLTGLAQLGAGACFPAV
jgi:hypothetical protein